MFLTGRTSYCFERNGDYGLDYGDLIIWVFTDYSVIDQKDGRQTAVYTKGLNFSDANNLIEKTVLELEGKKNIYHTIGENGKVIVHYDE